MTEIVQKSLVLLYVIIAMPIGAQNEPPRQTVFPNDSSSIQSIEDRARRAEKYARRWNQAYMWLGFAALAIGFASAFSLYFSNKEAQSLGDIQKELIREKDRRLASDLKDKDVKISAADERAGIANRSAGDANKAAGEAKERAAKLDVEAADARHKTEELALAAEQLRKENAAAALALEKEKRDRLELEASLSDRLYQDQMTSASALSAFSGTTAFIEYLDNSECKGTAEQINLVLSTAKWSTSGSPGTAGVVFFEGVIVSTGGNELHDAMTHRTPSIPLLSEDLMNRSSKSSFTADALVEQLNQHGIQARRHAADRRFPIGTLAIKVGEKPNPASQNRPLVDEGEPGG